MDRVEGFVEGFVAGFAVVGGGAVVVRTSDRYLSIRLCESGSADRRR